MTNVRYGKTDPAQRNLENDFYAILGGNIGPVIPVIVDGELDIWRMVASAVQSDVGPVLLLAGNRFQSASVLFEHLWRFAHSFHGTVVVNHLLAGLIPDQLMQQMRCLSERPIGWVITAHNVQHLRRCKVL